MLQALKAFFSDEEAPTAVEYALIVAGIAVAIVGAVYALGGVVNTKFNTAANSIK